MKLPVVKVWHTWYAAVPYKDTLPACMHMQAIQDRYAAIGGWKILAAQDASIGGVAASLAERKERRQKIQRHPRPAWWYRWARQRQPAPQPARRGAERRGYTSQCWRAALLQQLAPVQDPLNKGFYIF